MAADGVLNHYQLHNIINKIIELDGGIGIIEMLYKTNILALSAIPAAEIVNSGFNSLALNMNFLV